MFLDRWTDQPMGKGMTVAKSTILHVIDTTGPGGAETVFIQLAEACKKEGYRSIALIRGAGWVEEQLKARAIEYYVLDCKGSFNVKYLWNLIRLIKKLKVHTIQSHLLGSNVYASMAGLLTRTKVVSTFHGHVDISPNERFRSLKFSIIGLGSRKVVAVTKDLYQSILGMGNQRIARKAIVIANGIDLTAFKKSEIYQPKLLKENKVVFGCLGNIRTAKNYKLAIDFIHALDREGHNVCLRIAGDDSKVLARELKEYVKKLNMESKVEFLGFIDDVPSYLSGIDVFLMTSTTEGHPLALTQALAAGLLILSTPSGVEEIVDDSLNSFISRSTSVDSLIESFAEIVNKPIAELVEIRTAAKNLATLNYSQQSMIREYTNYYD